LDDLEEKKRRLLSALEGSDIESADVSVLESEDKTKEEKDVSSVTIENDQMEPNKSETTDEKLNIIADDHENTDVSLASTSKINDTVINVSTPESKAGKVKTTAYGTPVINVASPYVKLPTDDKFAKDICDVINFENLPNSTGKYKQISHLLKKVKSEVDRIQES
jgi:zinc finger CCHC domain-containing protein 8